MSKATFVDDNFVGEDLLESFCEGVEYDVYYSDKVWERYHINKMLKKQKKIKNQGLVFVFFLWSNILWDKTNLFVRETIFMIPNPKMLK